MAVDMEQLKKSAILLKAIFEEALKVRLNNSIISNPERPCNGQEEVAVELTGDQADNIHLLYTKMFENYDWNLEKFFEAAANPQMHLFLGKDWLTASQEKGGSMTLREYKKLHIPDLNIKEKAQHAMKNIEKLASEI